MLFIIISSLFSLTLLLPTAKSKGEFKCSSGKYKSVCLKDDYSSFDLPKSDAPNEILVSMNVDDVLNINEDDHSIHFSTYFNVEWNETRLYVAPALVAQQAGFQPYSEEIVADLWMPNIFIYSLKSFSVTSVFSSLSGIWIDSNKAVLYSKASHISFFCPMTFAKFPFDTQSCKLLLGSYSFNNKKMVFTTREVGYSYKSSNSLALGYDLKIAPLDKDDQVRNFGELGTYSLAGFELVLTRHSSKYIFSYYFPSGFLVVASWISFLIPSNKMTSRNTLLAILFLVMINLLTTITTTMPKADGLTAIEVWLLTCSLFLAGAMAECGAILLQQLLGQGDDGKNIQLTQQLLRLDKMCLLIFPGLFLLFNLIYWPACLG